MHKHHGTEPAFMPPGIDWGTIAQPHNDRIGLAVSGGGDSIALAVLYWEVRGPYDVMLLTVDHGLRAEAAEEVDAVQRLARDLGFGFSTMTVKVPFYGNMQAWARKERYRLLHRMAEIHGLRAVVTAHTLDDQAETFLLRLRRRSGLKGLSGMRPVSVQNGLTVLRPFLGARREDLRRALVEREVKWYDDPSNDDMRFDRIAIRKILPTLAAIGIDAPAIAASAAHLASASDILEREVADLWMKVAKVGPSREVYLDEVAYRALPPEYRRRILLRAVKNAGSGRYEPRARTILNIDRELVAGRASHGGGARVVPLGKVILAIRDTRHSKPVILASGSRVVYDNRLVATSAPGTPDCRLNTVGWSLTAGLPSVAHPLVMQTAPFVWVDDRLVAAPTLGIRRKGWPASAVRIVPLDVV